MEESTSDLTVEYQHVLDEASKEDLVDLENMMSIGTGVDREGNNVIILIPSVVFANTKDYDTHLRRLFLLFVKKAHDLVQEPYILVYCHTHLPILSQQRFIFSIHKMLPRTYKKNLEKLIVVHPTFLIKAFFEGVRWFISDKFYRKLSFVSSVAELQSIIPPSNIPLPATFLAAEDAQKGFKWAQYMTPLHVCFDPLKGTTPLIHRCMHHIRHCEEGLSTPGIFRLAGNQVQADLVKTRVYGKTPEEAAVCVKIGADDVSAPASVSHHALSVVVITDIHTVTAILKMTLRDLEEPLFCFSVYDQLIQLAKQIGTDGGSQSEALDETLNQVLQSMPECNYRTLLNLLRYHSEKLSIW